MLKFLTSLSFLYALTIGVLLLFGLVYYRDFVRSGYQRRRFPWVFLIISAACFSFLYFNIHASLKLKTFSNLDHHFIRHDGFEVARSIELGRSDTINYAANIYNRFVLKKQNNQLLVSSVYAEEPFYASSTGKYKLLSVGFTAAGHSISFQCDSLSVSIRAIADTSFELQVNKGNIFQTNKIIRKGISGWNLFKDDISFISSAFYTNEKLVNSLRSLLLLRDDVSKEEAGELKYFISGRLFQYSDEVKTDQSMLHPGSLSFSTAIPDKSTIAWGMGFLDNNKNQFRVQYLGNDSFALMNRYPVSYPLTEEDRNNWSKHSVNKFLISDSKDMLGMPAVFNEGFLFAAFNGDNTIDFSPVLLTFQKSGGDDPLQLQARFMNGGSTIYPVKNKLLLPARSSNFSWMFSIQNSFNWNFGNRVLPAKTWQFFLFGTLFIFFLLVFASSWLLPANKLSWIWQLLAGITMVLLSTRFFL